MSTARFTAESTKETVRRLKLRLAHSLDSRSTRFIQYSADEYEKDVAGVLSSVFPYSVLSGIRLFSPNQASNSDYGYEIDNLLHIKLGEVDYIVAIEAKKQAINVIGDRWIVKYDGVSKCAREQVDKHIQIILEYLEPIARNVELKFVAIVVSSDRQTPQMQVAGYRNSEIHLCAINDLLVLLRERFDFDLKDSAPEVFRVSQSGFLDVLRLSLPVEALGHPELASSIRYVDRCRRSLDESLFRHFEPTSERWVINGSAGMGKSVLLAYTAAVLCSGHELYRFQGEVGTKKATERFHLMGFDPDPKLGSIVIMAMSAKQLDNIKHWFDLFVSKFQQGDLDGSIRFRRPEFILCRDGRSFQPPRGRRWCALLLDEAHDLPAFGARELSALYSRGGLYLVIACDRHQKLRLSGAGAKIIEGLDFKNKSLRLRQVYRNPAPVYLASLALMFRWFSDVGPKVLPSLKDLHEQFGLRAEIVNDMVDGKVIEISMKSDAHPANSWCHTVGTFPDVNAAYTALIREKMGHGEVLWVRFSQEDTDFDYEKLNKAFTYHNCRNHDAEKINDKYIKGQDYPVVVIEGFPRFMDRYEEGVNETTESAEAHMWSFRRELYLCASRATAFLYFVCNVDKTEEIVRIQREIEKLVAAVSMPETASMRRTRTWRFQIKPTTLTRRLDVFADTATGEQSDIADDSAAQSGKPVRPVLMIPSITTARSLAGLLGIPQLRVILLVRPHIGNVTRDQPFEYKYAARIAAELGFNPREEN